MPAATPHRPAAARDRRGVSATEFALILPILVHVQRRHDRVQPADPADPEAAERRLHPRRPHRARPDAERGAARRTSSSPSTRSSSPSTSPPTARAIVTSVGVNADDDPVVNWQRSGVGRRSRRRARSAREGELADACPDDLDIVEGETIIAAEVFYRSRRSSASASRRGRSTRSSYYKPRLGTLDTLLP